MSHGKQFTLFTHSQTPNGTKVAIVLNILGLSYEPRYLNWQAGEIKGPEHTKYNPNGRIPTLIDHKNNDFVVWESDAILLYLVVRYDTEHKIFVATPDERASVVQWLFFQASGQGPYFGQAAWFASYHPEKIPSAIERYRKEVRRILGVLESVLDKQDWLVGGKMTVADLSFVTWNNNVGRFFEDGDFDFEKEFSKTNKWHKKMIALDGVKAAYRAMAEQANIAAKAE
ncbi:Glutathione S-transferase 2 [Steccherinum ochraceum]|uniref:glutathione transferase n=1 Tax=Steccherinum ochraceum TaxID=92696 RepID=A0A4V2MUZ3_9APHY|nr:Glutathione S-transferase 2 [Steccherinum ochraceum]